MLEDALTSVVGRVVATQEHGSHTVAFVEVDAVAARHDDDALVYFQRRFHGITVPADEAISA